MPVAKHVHGFQYHTVQLQVLQGFGLVWRVVSLCNWYAVNAIKHLCSKSFSPLAPLEGMRAAFFFSAPRGRRHSEGKLR